MLVRTYAGIQETAIIGYSDNSMDWRCCKRGNAGDVRQGDLAGMTRARLCQSFSRMHILYFGEVTAPITAGYLSVGPMAQCVVHALKGLACRPSPSRAR